MYSKMEQVVPYFALCNIMIPTINLWDTQELKALTIWDIIIHIKLKVLEDIVGMTI